MGSLDPQEQLSRFGRYIRWIALGLAIVIALVILELFILFNSGDIKQRLGLAEFILKLIGGGGFLYMYYRHHKKNLDLQHQTTVNRGKLALNVELEMDVTPHNGGYFIRPTVRVRNASSKLFRVPVVYISGRLVPADELPRNTAWEALRGCDALRTTNTADYGTVMVQLAPEETEQFTTWFYVSPELIAEHPSIVIRADVLGAEEKKGALADKKYRTNFVQWMNDHSAHTFLAFRSWPAGKLAEAEKSGLPLPSGRCLMLPPADPDATPTEVDIKSSFDWRAFLDDDTMMWDRYAIIPLGSPPNEALQQTTAVSISGRS